MSVQVRFDYFEYGLDRVKIKCKLCGRVFRVVDIDEYNTHFLLHAKEYMEVIEDG